MLVMAQTMNRPAPGHVPAEELAAAEAELDGLPARIAEAKAVGDAEALSHLLARKMILDEHIEQLRVSFDTRYVDALREHVVELGEAWVAAEAARREVVVEAQARIREATAAAAEAQAAVVGAEMEIERLTKWKPDSWWQARGLLVPGAPPIAETVLATFELSKYGKALRERGKSGGAVFQYETRA